MPARLVALNGTTDIVLSGLLTIAGRHDACDARLDSARVSRRHCCLAFDGGEVLVRDLGSHNGTWINGRRVEVGVLSPGDVLGIAHLRFRLLEFSHDRAISTAGQAPADVPRPGDPLLEQELETTPGIESPPDDAPPWRDAIHGERGR